jgi:hypothetical protein
MDASRLDQTRQAGRCLVRTRKKARAAIGNVLTEHAQDALNDAAKRMETPGQPVASPDGMNRTEANAARRDLDLQANQEAKGALRDVMRGGRDTERQLWSVVPDVERDYSGVQARLRT